MNDEDVEELKKNMERAVRYRAAAPDEKRNGGIGMSEGPMSRTDSDRVPAEAIKSRNIEPVPEGMKRCSKCKEIKSIEEFCHNKNSKDGLGYWCRDCYKCYKLSRVDVKKTKENAACPHGVWIDLSRYPDLLKEIERIAENEERTVEAQIRWWIRRNFHSFKQGDMA